MTTIDEKIAALRKRWSEIHNTPPVKEKPERVPFVSPIPLSGFIRDWVALTQAVAGGEKGGKNTNPALARLKKPIIWIGNLAVGEDNMLVGRWLVIPPVGITISYFGEGAKQKALDRAEDMKGYY